MIARIGWQRPRLRMNTLTSSWCCCCCHVPTSATRCNCFTFISRAIVHTRARIQRRPLSLSLTCRVRRPLESATLINFSIIIMMMAARERCERGNSDRIYDVIGVFWPDKRAELKIITIVCVCVCVGEDEAWVFVIFSFSVRSQRCTAKTYSSWQRRHAGRSANPYEDDDDGEWWCCSPMYYY